MVHIDMGSLYVKHIPISIFKKGKCMCIFRNPTYKTVAVCCPVVIRRLSVFLFMSRAVTLHFSIVVDLNRG